MILTVPIDASATPSSQIKPGHYKLVMRGERFVVKVACENCGTVGELDHHIKPDGQVWPSVVCPAECGWHVYIRLATWPGVDIKPVDTVSRGKRGLSAKRT